MALFTPKQKKNIPANERVPLWEKLALATGSPVEQFTIWVPLFTLLPAFNMALGVSPAKMAMALVVFRLWDAITDPLVGNISDNFRSRWGRRKPFIVVGAICCGLTLPLLFNASADWSDGYLFGYLTICSLLVYTSFTVFQMPWLALGCEMTPNYEERTRVIAWRAAGTKIAAIVGGMVWGLTTLPIFQDPQTGEIDLLRAIGWIGICMGGAILLLGPISGLVLKERYYEIASKAKKTPLLRSIKETLSSKPFLIILGVTVAQLAGALSVKSLGLYVNQYKVCAGNMALAFQIQSVVEVTQYLVALLSIPFWVWVGKFIDKRKALLIIVCLNIIGQASMWYLYTPANPWLQVIPQFVLGLSMPSIWLFIPSMIADVIDLDELKTGARREGSFNAVFTWVLKLSIAVVIAYSGFLITGSGFDVALPAQPEEVLTRMHIYLVVVPCVIFATGFFLLLRYNLTRKTMADVREQLEARRGALG